MNAKEARDIAEKKQIEQFENWKLLIMKEIKQAAENGRFSVSYETFPGVDYLEIKNWIKSLGFGCKLDGYNNICYISW